MAQDRSLPVGAAELFAGGGEMGARMRSMDWAQTPLGPVSSWPQSLRTSVSICLNSRFPMLLWWGPELVMLYNDAYRSIPGDKHPGCLGARGQDVWPEIWPIIGPMLHGVMERGEATWSEDTLLLLVRNGFAEECYFTFSYSPIRDESGGVAGVFTAVTETTQQVLSERRLRTSGELASRAATARTAEDACALAAEVLSRNPQDVPFSALYLLSADGTSASLAACSGVERGAEVTPARIGLDGTENELWPVSRVLSTDAPVRVDHLGARFEVVPSPADMPLPRSALVLPLRRAGEATITGVLVAGLSPRLALTGDYERYLQLVANQIATGIANARALAEATARAEALAEVDRAKTTFFTNVSHEFRTPLTLLLGPLEELLERRSTPPETHESLKVAHRNALRLLKLVNALLDFARIEAGRMQASFEPVELFDFTRELTGVFESAAARAGLELRVEGGPLDQRVYVDRELWEKVVFNLVSNALKYTSQGMVCVRVTSEDGRAVVRVRDTGPGIPAEDLPRLFERFHRARQLDARNVEGSGLGLALAHGLVKLHGGTLGVQSVPGEGSTFTITLPFGADHLPREQVSQTSAPSWSPRTAAMFREDAERALADRHRPSAELFSGERPRILVVDDNADMRAHLRHVLAGFAQVVEARDGEEALAAVRRNAPSLVLSDVMMPRLDGFGLVRALKGDPLLRNIPVILLSARAGEEATVEGLRHGADDYIVKPFSARELQARISATLTLQRSRNAHQVQKQEELARLEGLARAAVGISGARTLKDALQATTDAARALIPSHRAVGSVTLASAGAQEVTALSLSDEGARGREPGPARGELSAPLVAREGRNIGVIQLSDRLEGDYTEADQATLVQLARIAAIATENVWLYARAEETNRLKDEFLSTLSHELRTPLASILGWAQLMKHRPLSDEKRARALDLIEKGARAQTQLVEDLLDVSRIVSGKLTLQVARVDMAQVCRAAVEVLRHAADNRRIELLLEVDEAGFVNGDGARLQQVVWNLVSNAVKFTPEGGQVRVRALALDGQSVITVSDTGMGIPDSFLPYVFDRFRQADGRSTRMHAGLGLGLSIVRDLVEMHGGTVSAESPGEGRGAVFTARIPLSATQAAAAPADRAAQPERVKVTLGPVSVLVLDDDVSTREMLAATLQAADAKVTTASSVEEALRAVAEALPDVIVSDIAMPGEDGYSLVRRLRALPANEGGDIPAIALTAFASPADAQRALNAGFQQHLPKPVEATELVAAVAHAIAWSPRRGEVS